MSTTVVLIKREIFRMLGEPTRLFGVLMQPLVFWLVIGTGFSPSFRMEENASIDYLGFFYAGILAMVILFGAIFSTITLIEDRASGFLQGVLVAPGGRFSVVLGKVLGVSLLALLQAMLFLTTLPFAGFPLGEIRFDMLFAFLGLGSFALASLGFVFAWWTGSTMAYHALMSTILIPMWILSGALFPPKGALMETLVFVNPMGWIVAGIRAAFFGGVIPEGTAPAALSVSVAFSLLFLFSVAIFSVSVWVCRRKR